MRWTIGAIVLVAGCVAGDEPDDGVATSAITHGTPAASDAAVVGISRDGTNLSCTGTLIAPRVVLTAGHCVTDTPPKIVFGPNRDDATVVIGGLLVHRHPEYSAGPPLANDLALILLAEPAPAEIEPVPLSPCPLDASHVGAPLRIVGFGRTSDGGFGVKNEGAAKISDVTPTSFRLTGDPAQTCAGDSGGPAFLVHAGVEYLAGVTSAGDLACEVYGRSTRVDVYLEDFIEPFLEDPYYQDWGETELSAGCATGHGGDGFGLVLALAVVLTTSAAGRSRATDRSDRRGRATGSRRTRCRARARP